MIASSSRKCAGGIATCVLAIAMGMSGCRAEPPSAQAPPNVFIYLVDTLRLDHLGIYGYSRDPAPHLTEFAADAVRFDHAYTPSSWTRPAVASLLSGLYPAQHGARTRLDKIAPGVVLMGEYLRDAGYQTAAFVSNVNVLPIWGFERGFDRFVDAGSDREDDHSDKVTDAVFRALDEHPSEPFLFYIHTRDPHRPYSPPPPFDQRWPPDAPRDATNRPDGPKPRDFETLIRNYDGEVSFNDDQFGRLMDRLKAEGLYRHSLIIFTADHGEEFDERGIWGHGESLFGEVVRIPLLIKLPKNRHANTVVDQRATLIDLLPTVLAAADVAPPEQLPGIDLLPAIEQKGDPRLDARPLFFDLDLVGANGRRTLSSAVIRGPYKYLERQQPVERIGLWNLDRDRLERQNVAIELPEPRKELAARLAAYRNTDHSGVHFWIRGNEPKGRRARGTLHTTGRFDRVREPALEPGDRVVVGPRRHQLHFDFGLASGSDRPDRDGIVFDVIPPDAQISIRRLTIGGRAVPVLLGRDETLAGSLPIPIDREAIAIDQPDDLFRTSDPAVSTAHVGFVNRSQGELSDLADPIVERLKALGYVQ